MTPPRWHHDTGAVESSNDHDSDGPRRSRRQVLRWTGMAAGAGLVGTGTFSGTALAWECPRTPGFWGNWNWCEVEAANDGTSVWESLEESNHRCEGSDPLSCNEGEPGGELEFAGICKTMEEWQEFLLAPSFGDKGHIMAVHLLATVLNFQRRPSDDPDCVDRSLEDADQRTIRQIKWAAHEWLDASNFPEEVDDWVVDGTDGEPLKDALDDFNNGRLAELDCSCDGEDETDGESKQTEGQGDGNGRSRDEKGRDGNGESRGQEGGEGTEEGRSNEKGTGRSRLVG